MRTWNPIHLTVIKLKYHCWTVFHSELSWPRLEWTNKNDICNNTINNANSITLKTNNDSRITATFTLWVTSLDAQDHLESYARIWLEGLYPYRWNSKYQKSDCNQIRCVINPSNITFIISIDFSIHFRTFVIQFDNWVIQHGKRQKKKKISTHSNPFFNCSVLHFVHRI